MKRIGILLVFLLSFLPAFPFSTAEPAAAATDGSALNSRAMMIFRQCAFHPEYGPAEEQPLVRWEGEIRVWAGGSATREDLSVLDAFLDELGQRVPGLPPVRRVKRDLDANVRIWFIPEYMMKFYIEGYVDGNWGFFHYESPGNVIVSARIGIAEDVTDQEERNHLILEELTGALGLPGDHMFFASSILYEGWTVTQSLSAEDWGALNILYSPVLSPGMTRAEAENALREERGP